MAKKIVYGISIDSTDAQGSIKRIEERLQELNQTADTSQREINTLAQELKELGQTRTDQTENINSVQSLRRAYRELIEELQRTEAGTERFQELAQAAGEVKNKIDEAQDSVNNFNKSPFENLRNNFRSLRQRIVDLDLDGFKQDFRDLGTNFRLAGQELIGIQKGAGIAANGLRVFRTALISTGIGAVVVAIGTLIANFDTLKESGGLIGGTFKLLGNIINAVTTSVLKLSDGLGLTSNAYQTFLDTSGEAKKETSDLTEEIQKLKEELDGVDFDEKLQKQVDRYTKSVKDLEKEQLKLTKTNTVLEIQSREAEKRFKRATDNIPKLENAVNKVNEAVNFILTSQAETVNIPLISGAVKELGEFEAELLTSTLDNATKKLIKLKLDELNTNIKNIQKNKEEQAKIEKSLADEKLKIEQLLDLQKRKISKDRNKAEFDSALALLEEEQKQRLIILLNDFKNEEDLKKKTEALDVEFLKKRKELFRLSGFSTADIEIALAQKVVNEKIKLEKKLEKEKVKFSISPIGEAENLKLVQETANERIRLFQREIDFAKKLTESEEIRLMQDINFADEKIRILEAYNLQETEQYEDAVRERQLAELEFFKFKKEQRDKDLDEALKAEDELAQKNKQVRDSILNVTTQAVGQIQGIVNAQYENEIALAGDNQEKIEQIQKEQFETNKAFGIVNTIIDTAMAIMNIWANTPNPIAAGILSGVVAAIGAAQVAVIASQEFTPGSSSGASGFTANAVGSQSLGNVSSMQPNINFAQAGSGANVQTAGGGTSQSIDFTGSISVSEINDVQNLVNVYETSSIIGGG